MRTWTRAAVLTICGGPCRTSVKKGEPLLEIRVDGVKKVFRRCAACAEEPVPEDLAPLQDPAPIVPMAAIRMHHAANALPLDYKMVAAGDREPGEDG